MSGNIESAVVTHCVVSATQSASDGCHDGGTLQLAVGTTPYGVAFKSVLGAKRRIESGNGQPGAEPLARPVGAENADIDGSVGVDDSQKDSNGVRVRLRHNGSNTIFGFIDGLNGMTVTATDRCHTHRTAPTPTPGGRARYNHRR